MKFTKSLKIALNIIFHSKLRSWLTIIGIIIGIAAIVAIVSVGQGAQRSLEQNLNTLSPDMITISSGISRAGGANSGFRSGGGGGGFDGGFSEEQNQQQIVPKNLTAKDVNILRNIQNIAVVMGVVGGSTGVSYLQKSTKVSIQGVDPSVWKTITSTDLDTGRYLSGGDINVVVIGGRVATSVFSNVQINRQININGKVFKIVGILKESGNNDDSRIFMPIENAVLVLENKDKKNYDSIIIKMKDIVLTDDTVAQITSKLMLSHGITQETKKDFSVTSLKSIQQRVSSTLSTMALFLSAIASISLIVGAIGIMNTMFTSVLEKTKEIGIMKAIGAKNRDVLMIFLLNSGIIGLIGGILGVLLGVAASTFFAKMSGVSLGRISLTNSYVNPQLMLGVFALSLGVGLIAGAIPAYRASRLKPVDALRY